MKRFLRAYVRFARKVMLTALLTGLYLLGFGCTKLLAMVVRRGLLLPAGTDDSCWQAPEGYEADLGVAQEQS